MARSYVLALDAAPGDTPLYVRIARALASDMERGRLKPGERLPGSRTLATMLGVNRNTVQAALTELEAQGWVEPQAARGVFVRGTLPEVRPRTVKRILLERREVPTRPGFDLPDERPTWTGRASSPRRLILTGGVPDPRLFPRELLARAYRRALRRHGERLLDYGDAHGEPHLRAALADMLTRLRGLAASADDVLVTRGSQQAIWLAARAIVRPGDRVGVECWGYPPAWEALRDAGATLVPLAVDRDGLCIDALEEALASGPLRAVYLTPHHQYPTMAALDARRRLRLLELARTHRFAVLEDDYSHEFQYAGRPRLPLASSDRSGTVIYLGSLSKVLAPGLRIGYLVAPRPLVDRMAAIRTRIDRQGDAIAEAAVAELLEEGEVERHARRMRAVYRARRDVLVEALTARLGERVSFEVPQGGMALWVRVHGASPERWVARAKERDVIFRAGRDLALEPPEEVPFVRMGFTRLDERELTRAVRIAAEVF